MEKVRPIVGNWYQRPGRAIFEVVAIDEHARTVELQFFDGTVDEMDLQTWFSTFIEEAEAPEDYSGSMDLQDDNYEAKDDDQVKDHWDDPVTYLDQVDA